MNFQTRFVFERLKNSFMRGCENKRAYRSMAAALHARDLASRVAAKRHGIETTDAYQCQFCGKWHLGHSRRSIRR